MKFSLQRKVSFQLMNRMTYPPPLPNSPPPPLPPPPPPPNPCPHPFLVERETRTYKTASMTLDRCKEEIFTEELKLYGNYLPFDAWGQRHSTVKSEIVTNCLLLALVWRHKRSPKLSDVRWCYTVLLVKLLWVI